MNVETKVEMEDAEPKKRIEGKECLSLA